MGVSRLTLLLLLLLAVVAAALPVAWSLNSDGLALLALSERLVLPSSVLSTWNSSHPSPCRWSGVRCGNAGSGRVISLDLGARQVSGSLGPEIGLLTGLRRLNLSLNDLSGRPIPPELGNCTLLEVLDLSTSGIPGEIPGNLGNLRKLSYLSLYENSLTGEIPESLFQIPALELVYLHSNNLSGSIPPSVGNASSLQALWLGNNSLSGPLPVSIGNCSRLQELSLEANWLTGALPETLTNIRSLSYFMVRDNRLVGRIPMGSGGFAMLETLDLSSNYFEGDIPQGVGNWSRLVNFSAVRNNLSGKIPFALGSLQKLSELFLAENGLSGSIPPEIGKCRSLTDLQLQDNHLEGAVPRELGMLSDLKTLRLFNNSLSGEFPTEIWRISALQEVLIYNNNFSGQLPLDMAALPDLKNVTLFGNRFSGVIPQGLGVNSSLEIVDFSDNSFVGGIPPNLCSGKQLTRLILGSNLLQGSIPPGVGNCGTLKRLILKQNKLSGPIPAFSRDSGLAHMDLSGNYISGSIPKSLGKNCVNLGSINLSMNNLTGPIPPEIGNLVNLQVLNLSHNSLDGGMPAQVARCSKLYLLDAGFNSLSGSLPATMANMTQLSRLILQSNRFTGGIPDSLARLSNLLELQLGGNLFGGSIPPSLGSLPNLFALDLSGNGMIGDVPPNLGGLKMLQRLDLSANNLTGSLEPLGDLGSLVTVNVSYNHFAGPIPGSWQRFLNSSPSSFRGNSDLCASCQLGESTCPAVDGSSPCIRPAHKSSNHIVMVAVVGSLVVCLAAFVLLGYTFLRWKTNVSEEEPALPEGSSFLLNKVLEATEHLNERYIVGRGAHGTVYRAPLDQAETYAIKKLVFAARRGSNVSMLREIETIGKIRHRNLVRLVNFWIRNDYGLILYDYMENGSLHDVLHEIRPPPVLEWKVRYKIALGIAHGLSYLHHDCNPPIVHRDIKPRNILLDSEMEPHISDFGIARLLDQCSTSTHSSGIMGTVGYISPETAFSTRRSKESDVFSYGVVLLELLTRTTALGASFPENADSLVSWVTSTLDGTDEMERIVDPDLAREIAASGEVEEVRGALLMALRCTAVDPSKRPSMRDVVKQLTDVKPRIRSPHTWRKKP